MNYPKFKMSKPGHSYSVPSILFTFAPVYMASKKTLDLGNPIIEELKCKVAQDKTRLTQTSLSAT